MRDTFWINNMNGSTEPVDERCIITHNNYRKGWGFGLKLISLYRSINLQHLIHAARIGAVIRYPSMAGCIVKAGPVHTIGYRTKFTHKNPAKILSPKVTCRVKIWYFDSRCCGWLRSVSYRPKSRDCCKYCDRNVFAEREWASESVEVHGFTGTL